MKIPISWLKEYIDFNLTPEQLSDALTMAGTEVSAIEYLGGKIKNVVVGQIEKISQHPNADKLLVCEVNIGDKTLQIVTGAPNVKEGDKVPTALDGAILVNDFRIEKRSLRGIESFGMLCSTKELGLGEESAGIFILPPDAPIGADIKNVLGMNEVVLEIDILPNRGDLQSIIGVAREVAAITRGKVKLPKVEFREEPKDEGTKGRKDEVTVEIDDYELCPRYMARILTDVTIKESPDWMKQRLLSAGMRPINNVVDVTNYVLLEMGQPMHAFDGERLIKIGVRRAAKGEKIVTIDGEERILTENNLLITDGERPIALAGVMGGQNTEVSESTTTILLESAYFDPYATNRTMQEVKIRSESSIRFGKGVDWEGVERALDRGAQLIQQLAGAKILKGKADQKIENSPPKAEKIVLLRTAFVNRLLGVNIPAKEVEKILTSLGFAVKKQKEDFKVAIPLWRAFDVTHEADLIEEVARIWGYDKVESTLPKGEWYPSKEDNRSDLENLIRAALTASGLSEVNTFSLVSSKINHVLGIKQKSLKISNPLSPDLAEMRADLLPSLLDTLSYNLRHQIEQMHIFEIGKVFKHREEIKVAGVLYGKLYEDAWGAFEKEYNAPDYYYVKGIIENLFNRLGLKPEIKPVGQGFLHPGKAAEVPGIGYFGELHPSVANKYNFMKPVYVFEFDIEQLHELQVTSNKKNRFTSLPKYPSVNRDIALIVPLTMIYQEVLESIRQSRIAGIERIELFDRYEGKPLKEGFCNLAFSITYRDADKTLTDEEVNSRHQELIRFVKGKLGVEVRE